MSKIVKSYTVQMSYEVSDAEKMQAEKAILALTHAQKLLTIASDHLDIMKTPFQDHPDIDSKEIYKYRAALRRFRDKVIDNFNAFKITAFHCVNLIELFGSDTQTAKIVKSFVSSVQDIEKQVNQFAEYFTDLEAKNFVQNATKSIDTIQKECKDIIDLIDERIKTHLQTNIIGKSWVDGIGNDLQTKIQTQTPLMVELFNERQKQLNDLSKKR